MVTSNIPVDFTDWVWLLYEQYECQSTSSQKELNKNFNIK